ncbi:MAG TPA: DUF5107 domain-containing protein [Candidatus Wunengus sp. YC60]|uniref:DUF5107 domain-containing protein n=1 Tax=Candidatus Wunengus sp. YC60 TaxID=3367697 RepID=UPI004028DA4F
MSNISYAVVAALLVMSLAACSGKTATPASLLPVAMTSTPVTNDKVSLRQSTINWDTYKYELSQDNTIVEGSFDGVTITQQTFKSWVLENKYLKVTVVPEFGGRIISIIYKPTGHEELYRNPVGVPYSVGEDVFYYDWLMIYGGIFPTFPEPEHGKTWLLPWDFQIIKNTDQEVTIAMSIKDDIDNPSAPDKYNVGVTGIEAAFYVTVKAGRAAVDTTIELKNPGVNPVAYEYWTNTGLSPGSDPLDPGATSGAEIIAPIEKVKIPSWCNAISSQEIPAGETETYYFKNLRHYKNWPDPGIAYASPDMTGGNFWGVINHDNEEGFFRIADNKITPGLKIWTFGYPYSSVVDPYKTTDPRRPFVELWAGVTKEFWSRTIFPANHQFAIKETYSPSVGLTNVTHANENFLVNLYTDNSSIVNCQLFSINPDEPVNVSLFVDGTTIYNSTITPDPQNSIQISVKIPANISKGSIKFVVKDTDGTALFTGSIPVNN